MKRLGIFFFYDKDGIVGDYVSYYLNSIKPHLSYLIVVINGKINAEGKRKFEEFADEILVRENAGYDSWAYKFAMTHYGYENLKKFDELLLFNFTCYGGVYSFEPMFEEMRKRKCDCWGHAYYPFRRNCVVSKMQKTPFIPEHLMSYFMIIRKRMLADISWKQYWDTLEYPRSHGDAVVVNELRFTQYFENRGFVLDAWIPKEETYNYPEQQINFLAGKMLLEEYKSPLVKRKLFFIEYPNLIANGAGMQPCEVLDFIAKNTAYDENMIWGDLIRTQHVSVLHRNLHLKYILPENIIENKP
ncbi:MAG: rhamnan synthesis F family protein, partial [Endomicrobium sp.]|nr:rhamnan synthesis F family protein [Endomicrobium sp.]